MKVWGRILTAFVAVLAVGAGFAWAQAAKSKPVTVTGRVVDNICVLKWFRSDFDDHPGGLDGFLAAYLDDAAVHRALLAGGLAGVVYRPYDWRLASWTDRA